MTESRRPATGAMADDPENFLGRWSRRKRAGGAAPVLPAVADAPPAPEFDMATAEPLPAVPPGADPEERDSGRRKEGEAPDETDDPAADLPDVESLAEDSDYTGFLRKGVPEQLQKRALRKLWASNPIFGFRDGLDDYDEDFGLYFSKAAGQVVKTAWKLGKGFSGEDDKPAEDEAKDEAGEEAGEEAAGTATAATGDAAPKTPGTQVTQGTDEIVEGAETSAEEPAKADKPA